MEQSLAKISKYQQQPATDLSQQQSQTKLVDSDIQQRQKQVKQPITFGKRQEEAVELEQQPIKRERAVRRRGFKSELIKVAPMKVLDMTPSKRGLKNDNSDAQPEQIEQPQEIAQQKLEGQDTYCNNRRQSTNQSHNFQFVDYQSESSSSSDEQQNPQTKMMEQKQISSQKPESQLDVDITKYYRKQPQSKKSTFKASSLQQLAFSSIPQTFTIKCLIKVEKSLLFGDTYDLYLEDDKKLFLRATKGMMPMTSLIQIIDPKKKHKVAQMHKNFTGTQYVVLGKNTSSTQRTKTEVNEDQYSAQLSWITFSPNIFGFSGQKKISLIKRLRKVPKTQRFSDLKYCWEQGDRTRVQMLSHKMAEKINGNFELDFRGIVKVPSSKNTIIEDGHGRQCIVFGKRSQNVFVLHVSNPLSLIEGFAMGISVLDRKLLVH